MTGLMSRRGFCLASAATTLPAAGLHAQPAWQWAAPLPKMMGELVGVPIGASLFAMAGLDDVEHVPYGAVFRYDSPADRWTALPQMPAPAHHIMATALDGKIYVFGGFTRPPTVKAWQPTANAWSFDPQTGQWKALAPLPNPRGAGQAVAVGGRIYVIGGVSSNIHGTPYAPIPLGSPAQIVVGAVDEYDPAADTWRPRSPMPTPRNHYLAAEVGGKIYALNGRTGSVFVTMSDVTDLVEVYDPASDQWSYKSRAPTRRGDVAGGACNGRIYVTGGEYQDMQRKMAFWAAEAFNPAANTWEMLPHMQIARHGFAAAFLGDQLHVVGGSFQSDGMPGIDTPTGTHEVYDAAAKA